MEYQKFVQEVQRLDFIPDPETADAAVKAVLGILASRVDKGLSRRLTEKLPEPLTFEKLRSHQVRDIQVSFEEYIVEITAQFGFSHDESKYLIETVLHLTRLAVGDEIFTELEDALPADWAYELQKA